MSPWRILCFFGIHPRHRTVSGVNKNKFVTLQCCSYCDDPLKHAFRSIHPPNVETQIERTETGHRL